MDCIITKNTKYIRLNDNFYQFLNENVIYGLNFFSEKEANQFENQMNNIFNKLNISFNESNNKVSESLIEENFQDMLHPFTEYINTGLLS